MKKYLFLIAFAVCSVFAFAQAPTCRVYGSDNIATVSEPVATAIRCGDGIARIDYYVTLTKSPQSQTEVVIQVMDGYEVVATKVLVFPKGHTRINGSIGNHTMQAGKRYRVVIASASCQ